MDNTLRDAFEESINKIVFIENLALLIPDLRITPSELDSIFEELGLDSLKGLADKWQNILPSQTWAPSGELEPTVSADLFKLLSSDTFTAKTLETAIGLIEQQISKSQQFES